MDTLEAVCVLSVVLVTLPFFVLMFVAHVPAIVRRIWPDGLL